MIIKCYNFVLCYVIAEYSFNVDLNLSEYLSDFWIIKNNYIRNNTDLLTILNHRK